MTEMSPPHLISENEKSGLPRTSVKNLFLPFGFAPDFSADRRHRRRPRGASMLLPYKQLSSVQRQVTPITRRGGCQRFQRVATSSPMKVSAPPARWNHRSCSCSSSTPSSAVNTRSEERRVGKERRPGGAPERQHGSRERSERRRRATVTIC